MSAPTYISNAYYRAFGAVRTLNYGDTTQLNTSYDTRLRVTQWDVQRSGTGILGYQYQYTFPYFSEYTNRVSYAKNLYDATLDRSYEYDREARLTVSHTGAEARAHMGLPGSSWGVGDGPYSQGYNYDVFGNLTSRGGWGGENASMSASYDTHNRRSGFSYDASGNLTNDLGQNFTYDATSQQTQASYTGYTLQQGYDGDTLRVWKNDNGVQTYYLRSSVLGGQVIAEMQGGSWTRGYVYVGNTLIAVQQNNSVSWIHQDPMTKSQRVTNANGTVTSGIELDPWGGETNRSWSGIQPHRYTSYERDGNASDEAMRCKNKDLTFQTMSDELKLSDTFFLIHCFLFRARLAIKAKQKPFSPLRVEYARYVVSDNHS